MFTTQLKNVLHERYSSRRKMNVIELICYLKDPECLQRYNFKKSLLLPSHKSIEKLVEKLLKSFFNQKNKEKPKKKLPKIKFQINS